MRIVEAKPSDASAISDLLEELRVAGQRTRATDERFVLSHYLCHPQRLACFIVQASGEMVLGLQSLKIADLNNRYGTPPGWGIIGTHIRPSAARQGIGAALFAKTVLCARQADLAAIEAFIGESNEPALRFYEALGFRESRRANGAICKAYSFAANGMA